MDRCIDAPHPCWVRTSCGHDRDGLTLNGIEYRPKTADAGSSLNTVVITGFPKPNQVMQVLPEEEMRRAQ